MNETRIALLRRRRGWTQERLADESGVGVRTVQRMEAGRDASLETLSLVSSALHVPVRKLFADVDRTPTDGRLEAVELRTQLQQGARDRTTRRGMWAYAAGGGVITVCSLIDQQLAGALMFGYWIGVGLLLALLRNLLLEPRLTRRYPLSTRTALLGTPPSDRPTPSPSTSPTTPHEAAL